jgi:hypothetical protein
LGYRHPSSATQTKPIWQKSVSVIANVFRAPAQHDAQSHFKVLTSGFGDHFTQIEKAANLNQK